MSLVSFQRALADFVASPALCFRVRNNPYEVLSHYDLTPREHRRLIAVVGQRGMSTCCTLYRANRLTAIYTLLPMVCTVLGNDLKPELEKYWETNQSRDLQFKQESDRFARFIRLRVAENQLANPYVLDVIEFELAKNELMYLSNGLIRSDLPQLRANMFSRTMDGKHRIVLHPLTRLVVFSHDPIEILGKLGSMEMPDSDIQDGTYFLHIDNREGQMNVRVIDQAYGVMLRDISQGTIIPEEGQIFSRLISEDLICIQDT